MNLTKFLHSHALIIFVLSTLFGILYFASTLYSEYQNIILFECADRSLGIYAYKWRKDKHYGPTVEEDYRLHIKTEKFTETVESLMQNKEADLTYYDTQLNQMTKRVDVKASETILIIVIKISKFVDEEHNRYVKILADALEKEFSAKFGKVRILMPTLKFEAIASYIALNDDKKLVPDKADKYHNTLVSSPHYSFYSVKHMFETPVTNSSAVSDSIIPYKFNSFELKLLVRMSMCFGQEQLLMRAYLHKSQNGIDTFSCIPESYEIEMDTIDIKWRNSKCNKGLTALTSVVRGIGNSDMCIKEIDQILQEYRCGNETNDDEVCFNSLQVAEDTNIIIYKGLMYLLKDLYRWNNKIDVNAQDFAQQYKEAEKYLCDVHQKDDFEKTAGLESQYLNEYCWQTNFYEYLFKLDGIELKDWKKFKLSASVNGFSRGIAMLEANANEPHFVNDLFASKAVFFIILFSLAFPLYLAGLAITYDKFLKFPNRKRIFLHYQTLRSDLKRKTKKRKVKEKRKAKCLTSAEILKSIE